jgi:hypothetical protein
VSAVARAQERVTVDVLVELMRETAYAHVS